MISAFTARGLAVLCWSPWLIPHTVLLNAQNAGSAGKQTRPGVHPRSSVGPSPKRYGRSNYTSEHTHAQNARARIRAVHVIGLLHTEIVWHRSQSPHTIWCSPTHPHCHWDWRIRIGCAMAAERWVWANEISIFFLRRDQCLTHVLTQGIHTHTNFTSEWSMNIRPRLVPMP